MKIVIISSFFYPVIQPRSFRATELAKEFARQGHSVSVIPMNTVEDFDYIDYGNLNNLNIYPLKIFKQDGTALAASKGAKQSLLTKLFRGLISYLLCGRMIKYTQSIYKHLLQQDHLKDADMVIALSTPFCIHWALSKYIKKRGKNFISVADSGDPFYYSKQWHLALWFKYIEQDVYKQMDYLTIPTVNAIPSYSPLIPDYKIKIIPQGFDMRNIKVYNGSFGTKIRIAYAGVFYWDIRNPEFLFEYLENTSKDYELNLFLRYPDSILENTLNTYPNLKNHLNIRYNIPHDDLLYELSKMHFLVNIENLSNTQMPSKLIDYGMTGRPILSCNERNFSETLMDEFMDNDYRGRYVVDIEEYNIVHIANKFIKLVNDN